MGLLVDSQDGDGDGGGRRGFSCLIRRKQVDSVYVKSGGAAHHQLAKELTVPHLVAIGKLFIFIFIFIFLCLWNILNPTL